MGLFTGLLLLPLAPVRGVVWVAETLQGIAEQTLDDPQQLRRALVEAEEAHRRGEITDDELAMIEQHVVDRLVPMTSYGEVAAP